MRRALILPTVTILLLLGLCIANGLLLRQHTNRWSGMAAETARYARSERWPEARRELDALAADWDEAQSYLHIVVHHSTLREVQTLLTRCRTLCDTGDSQALLPELGELQCQLDALDALAAPEPPQAVRPRAAVARPMALRKSLRWIFLISVPPFGVTALLQRLRQHGGCKAPCRRSGHRWPD